MSIGHNLEIALLSATLSAHNADKVMALAAKLADPRSTSDYDEDNDVYHLSFIDNSIARISYASTDEIAALIDNSNSIADILLELAVLDDELNPDWIKQIAYAAGRFDPVFERLIFFDWSWIYIRPQF